MTTSPTSLGEIIRSQAQLGDKVAFSDPERDETFVQFEYRVNKLVDSLHRLGLRRGERIAVLSRNCVNAVECLATAKAGFIPVPLNWRLSAAELVNLIDDCEPGAIVCDDAWAQIADDQILPHTKVSVKIAFGKPRQGWEHFETVVEGGDSRAMHPEALGHEIAFLIYTSGTTGAPKAAMISHEGVIANGRTSSEEAIGVSEADTALCVMPLFHVGGLCYYLLPSYMAGATVILRPAFEVNDMVNALERSQVTNVHLVPTMISDLVAHPDASRSAASLKRIVYAGSAMPVALLERAMATFPECDFSQSYGSTEGGIISTLGPDEHRKAAESSQMAHLLHSCGRPLSRTSVRIIDEENEDCFVGQAGEVLVQSSRTMLGYWGLPDKTAAVFTDAYLQTGDVGYLDSDGYMYLVDRKNDMIVTGGENVYPSEVEDVLYRCPDVAEAVVFGIPDSRWIEKVVAAVVLKHDSTASPESVAEFVRMHLTSYKCPKKVYIVDDLPRSGVGKFSRKDLRRRYGAEGVDSAKAD